MKPFNLGTIVFLTLAAVVNGSAYAIDLPTVDDDSLDQVTSVSQLTDVKPTGHFSRFNR